jgi:hypothetical protein
METTIQTLLPIRIVIIGESRCVSRQIKINRSIIQRNDTEHQSHTAVSTVFYKDISNIVYNTTV